MTINTVFRYESELITKNFYQQMWEDSKPTWSKAGMFRPQDDTQVPSLLTLY